MGVQEMYTPIVDFLVGEFDAFIDGVQLIIEIFGLSFLDYCQSIVHISLPHSRPAFLRRCGYGFLLKVFHKEVTHDR